MRLLDSALLAGDAHIVIAGSEAARGDVPAMDDVDLPGLAERHFGGDRTARGGRRHRDARHRLTGAAPRR